jgi:hypothetical protein
MRVEVIFQAQNLEGPGHPRGGSDDAEFEALVLHPPGSFQQDPDPRGIRAAHPPDIHHQTGAALGVLQNAFQGFSRGQVQVSFDV